MPCDHRQPEDIMIMAEAWLRDHAVPKDRWLGTFVHHAENTPGGMWGSVVMEMERRGEEWIVTRLDRNREALQELECGLRVLLKD
jgi:hypothetical protein